MIPSADDIRNITAAHTARALDHQQDVVRDAIHSAATNPEYPSYQCTITNLYPETIKALKELGYSVTKVLSPSEPTYKISWELTV